MNCLRDICKVSLKDKIISEIILYWCNVARVSNITGHRRLRWLESSQMAQPPQSPMADNE